MDGQLATEEGSGGPDSWHLKQFAQQIRQNCITHNLKKQKDATKCAAIATWGERYYNNPHTTMAFKTALRNPPDGRAHHTFNIKPTPGGERGKPEPNRNNRERETKVKFSRFTHSTLLRFITGHAFIGEYTKRFYPPRTNRLPMRRTPTDS